MRCLGILWIGMALLFCGSRSEAHFLIPLSIEELTRHADAVVQGRVIARECRQSDKGSLYTINELEVQEVWKGEVESDVLEVYQSGGTLGARKVRVYPSLEFELGGVVLCFLVKNPNQQWITLANVQGKFEVFQLAGSAQKMACNPFHGTPPNETANIALQSVQGATANQRVPLPLNALKKNVQEVKP